MAAMLEKNKKQIRGACRYQMAVPVKYLRKVLGPELAPLVAEAAGQAAIAVEGELVECSVEPNLVVMVVELPGHVAPNDFVRTFRQVSKAAVLEADPTVATRIPNLWTQTWLVETMGQGIGADELDDYLSKVRTSQRTEGLG